ncbi:hypothetical protein TNIN_482241 [Trichonephila inaurata madagascariensis]|uniref:WAP domain-containing protein n=1 Tax=Trichonephila inaurata madagascariensis TaxID=2747483 RepID=A0A8X7BS62_9ARAC|nr:hypothetical protein TNIN_482241 [Trichonephila inaurata madagascariensis]
MWSIRIFRTLQPHHSVWVRKTAAEVFNKDSMVMFGVEIGGKCPPIPDIPCHDYVANCCSRYDCGKEFICCQTNCQFQCLEELHEEFIPDSSVAEVDLNEEECAPYKNKTTK